MFAATFKRWNFIDTSTLKYTAHCFYKLKWLFVEYLYQTCLSKTFLNLNETLPSSWKKNISQYIYQIFFPRQYSRKAIDEMLQLNLKYNWCFFFFHLVSAVFIFVPQSFMHLYNKYIYDFEKLIQKQANVHNS